MQLIGNHVRSHNRYPLARRNMRRAAAVIGLTACALTATACQPDTSTPRAIESMVGISPSPTPIYKGHADARINCVLGAENRNADPRILIDGRVGEKGQKHAVPGSTWDGEITAIYKKNPAGSVTSEATFWVAARYQVAPSKDALYGLGASKAAAISNIHAPIDDGQQRGRKVIDELRLPNGPYVEVTTTNQPNSVYVFCQTSNYEAPGAQNPRLLCRLPHGCRTRPAVGLALFSAVIRSNDVDVFDDSAIIGR